MIDPSVLFGPPLSNERKMRAPLQALPLMLGSHPPGLAMTLNWNNFFPRSTTPGGAATALVAKSAPRVATTAACEIRLMRIFMANASVHHGWISHETAYWLPLLKYD